MNAPLYEIGQKLYLRESAALGYLEAVQITGITLGEHSAWLYSYAQEVGQQQGSTYGDRRSLVFGKIIYLDESELVDYCTALGLVKANLQARMNEIDRLFNSCT